MDEPLPEPSPVIETMDANVEVGASLIFDETISDLTPSLNITEIHFSPGQIQHESHCSTPESKITDVV